jgi:hypothetical protein
MIERAPFLRAGSRLAEIHQFPDGTIVETLHTHAALELLDRDLPGETVIGTIKADQPGHDPLEAPSDMCA